MRNIAIKYGLWMFVGFTAFFLIMHALGYSQNYYLRLLNAVIHLSLIYVAIKAYREKNEESVSNYLSGVAMGMYASAIGVLLFTIFMYTFLTVNTEFTQSLIAHMELSGKFVLPIGPTAFLLVEGIATSLIGSYIMTRIIDMRKVEARSSNS